MKEWIRTLGSLKLSVTLVVALLVALAAGTIVESMQGTEQAQSLVYFAPWFQVLLGALGVNTLFALIDKWPPTKHRIGFYVTHSALLLIIVGALITQIWRVEGQLALWEGQQSSVAQTFEGGQLQVPFTVRLDDFQVETYQGTMRPSQFRSRITVIDPEIGPFPAIVQMNHELTWRGFDVFQSSYQQADGREMSVLTVSKDPGQLVVFIGYYLLMAGMAIVLGTRMVQAKARARLERDKAARREEEARVNKARNRKASRAALLLVPIVVAGLLAATLFAPAAQAQMTDLTGPLPAPEVVQPLRAMPVQHDGRVMPLDTLAREGMYVITGQEDEFKGLDPVTLALAWTFHGQAWARQPVVKVNERELAALANLPAGTDFATFQQLAGSQNLLNLFASARAKGQAGESLSPLEEDAQKLESRLLWLNSFLSRDAVKPVPPPGRPTERWATIPAQVTSAPELLAWYEAQRANPPEAWPPLAEMQQELNYNRVHPTRLSWWLLIPAMLVSLGALRMKSRLLDILAISALMAGFAVMTWGIGVRWAVADRIPASNMYESMLFLGWGIGLFALVAAAFLRNRLVIFNAAAMAALTMFLVDVLPVDPFVHPMAPVLSGTPWLAIHVPIIMVSYSVLALGVLVAHLQIGVQIFKPRKQELVARMNDLLYWYMHIGSLLLVAGIITGSIWAASSWGRYWGWDPKEVWSLIAFLAYMAILHGRFDRMIGPFGVAAASIIAFWTVLMTYLGVNFILASGLHSYGFGSGGLVQWMAGIFAVEIVFLGAGYIAHRRNRDQYGPLKTAVS